MTIDTETLQQELAAQNRYFTLLAIGIATLLVISGAGFVVAIYILLYSPHCS